MVCQKCGAVIPDAARFCTVCGAPAVAQPPKQIIMTTTEHIPGKTFEIVGLVSGSTVESVHAGKDILAGFKNLVGGELTAYTEMMVEARRVATDRMLVEARNLDADAVICMRYASSSVTQGASELMAYGTAVRFVE